MIFPSLRESLVGRMEVLEPATRQLRLYRAIRETMRAMAGRISGVASWDAKKLLTRHV
jgi:hypothetical protein